MFSVKSRTYVSLCYKKPSKALEIRVQASEICCNENANYLQYDNLPVNEAYKTIQTIVEKSIKDVKLVEADDTGISVKETLTQKIRKGEIAIIPYKDKKGGRILIRAPVDPKVDVASLLLKLYRYQEKVNEKVS